MALAVLPSAAVPHSAAPVAMQLQLLLVSPVIRGGGGAGNDAGVAVAGWSGQACVAHASEALQVAFLPV